MPKIENLQQKKRKMFCSWRRNLLGLLMRDKVSIETVIIMNDILNFWPMWTKKIKEDIIWPIWQIQIEKYTPFVQSSRHVPAWKTCAAAHTYSLHASV